MGQSRARRYSSKKFARFNPEKSKRLPSDKMTVTKVGGDQIHLVAALSKVGENASHRSHRVVASTVSTEEQRTQARCCVCERERERERERSESWWKRVGSGRTKSWIVTADGVVKRQLASELQPRAGRPLHDISTKLPAMAAPQQQQRQRRRRRPLRELRL